jgi:hypothetical protein
MSLEVRQLVLRAEVREEDDDGDDSGARAKKSCGDADDDACEDKESLKEEILAAVRLLVREELRALRQR